MKPYQKLTRTGRLRRMRQLAQHALAAYGIPQARCEFVRQAGNTLYRVYAPGAPFAGAPASLFEPDQYLLRVHQPGYQDPRAIELELTWMAAMRREADLPVQEPIPSLDGRLVVSINIPAVAGVRCCSLMRWIKGRELRHKAAPQHYRAQGRLMACMHDFAADWKPPDGLTKRRFDWDGLFNNDAGSGMPNGEAWKLLSPKNREAFSFVAERVREVMNAWGESPQVFGLIHADLGVEANLLFWHREPRAIDFDDSGYGYWVYDLAVSLEHCLEDAAFPCYRDALLAGYAEVRTLPDWQLQELELFMAASEAYWNLWATGGTHLHPQYLEENRARMQRTAGLVVKYVQACRQGSIPPGS